MDDITNEFISSIRRIVESIPGDSKNLRAKIIAVDEVHRTCEVEPLNGDADIPDTRLTASIDTEIVGGTVFIPKIGSSVIVSFLDTSDSEAYVSKFGEVAKIIFKFSDTAFVELSEQELIYQNQETEVTFTPSEQSFKVGEVLFEIKQDKLLLNGETGGGLLNISELKAAWNQNKAILDALLQVIGGAPINEPGNGAPSALQITLKAALAGKQPVAFNEGKLTSKKVMHGK
ncbi:MAG TPA: hypothetical protein DCS93_35685 [Microscillaceae bacterium]|nr:hypothetical protein [Microscillaceae bacterium]